MTPIFGCMSCTSQSKYYDPAAPDAELTDSSMGPNVVLQHCWDHPHNLCQSMSALISLIAHSDRSAGQPNTKRY